MTKQLGILLLLSLTSFSLWAAELFNGNVSARALAMGNAYSSVVRDSDSIFYNPAGLAFDYGFYWTVADARGGYNDAQALTNLRGLMSNVDYASTVATLNGKTYWFGGGGKTYLRLPFVSFGYYNSIDASIVDDPASDNIDINYINDKVYVLSLAAPVFPFTYFGVTGRHINRVGNRSTQDITTLADANAFDATIDNTGAATTFDLGLTFAVNNIVNPALSVVVKNVGGTSFSGGVEAPPNDEQELVVGASIAADLALITATGSVDINHADDSSIDFQRKLHVGAEVGLPLIDVRVGYNQGYWTAGAGMGIGPLQVDVVSYGVDVGTNDTPVEDRRLMAQVTIELGLGVSSSSSSSSGDVRQSGLTKTRKSRRLKQRR